MNQKDFGDQMLRASRSTNQILKELLKKTERATKTEAGMDVFIKAVDDGKTSPDQLAAMLKQMCIVTKQLARDNRDLSQILMVYIASGKFSSDAAQAATKVGRGDEAIRQMFQDKMNGVW